MASERQIAANRANAAKSKGPVTPEGKKKAAQNGLRHGMLARTVVLDGESLQRFMLLLDRLVDYFNPQSIVESTLVENLAVARWRQMRVWAIEKNSISLEMRKQAASSLEPGIADHDDATRASLAFRALSDQGRSLDLLIRYESRYERQFGRSLEQLSRLREKDNFAKRSQSSALSEMLDLDFLPPSEWQGIFNVIQNAR